MVSPEVVVGVFRIRCARHKAPSSVVLLSELTNSQHRLHTSEDGHGADKGRPAPCRSLR